MSKVQMIVVDSGELYVFGKLISRHPELPWLFYDRNGRQEETILFLHILLREFQVRNHRISAAILRWFLFNDRFYLTFHRHLSPIPSHLTFRQIAFPIIA